MVCLSRTYPFKFFKGYLAQILLGLFLNTLSHIESKDPYFYVLAMNINKLYSDCSKVLKKNFRKLSY